MTVPLLSCRDLSVEFQTPAGVVRAVQNVSFDLHAGETLGVVGESGSGKSVTAMSILGLVGQPPGRITGGEIRFKGRDLLRATPHELGQVRGREISMIFQDPMTSLNPVLSVGKQLSEAVQVHQDVGGTVARKRSEELLDLVGVPDPHRRFDEYPFQYSGGMRQRAMIAMAIAHRPKILIADEPTTALDVTIQAQVLKVLEDVKKETGTAIIMITHDLGLVAEMASRVVVMYAGKIVESGTVRGIFREPRHPYTLGLLSSIPLVTGEGGPLLPIRGMPPSLIDPPSGCSFHPRCDLANGRAPCIEEVPPLLQVSDGHSTACHYHGEMASELARVLRADAEPAHVVAPIDGSREPQRLDQQPTPTPLKILEVDDLEVHFPVKSGFTNRRVGAVRAVDGVKFDVFAGETLGIVGESGCGKSTLARSIVRLLEVTSGEIRFRDQNLADLRKRALRNIRKEVQIVFQDPYASLNPRMTVRDMLAEPLEIHRQMPRDKFDERVAELLHLVGLSPEHGSRYPHEFSGGQRQRVGIARALALEPRLLVLDEPVSALDVSVQAQIINLLEDLQARLGLAYILIAHDLSVIRHACDRVAVMYLGEIVEFGTRTEIFDNATHPYTQALLSAVPVVDPDQRKSRERIVLQGEVPSPSNPPSGCRFRTRCWKADEICSVEAPALVDRYDHGHVSACHFAEPLNPSVVAP